MRYCVYLTPWIGCRLPVTLCRIDSTGNRWMDTMSPICLFFWIKSVIFLTIFGSVFFLFFCVYIYAIWERPLSSTTYIYTTEQLRVESLAQGPSSGRFIVLGFEFTTFRSVVQCLNHWVTTALYMSEFVSWIYSNIYLINEHYLALQISI